MYFDQKNVSDVTQAFLTTFTPHGVSAQKVSQAPPLKKHPLYVKKPLKPHRSTYSLDLPTRVLHREVLQKPRKFSLEIHT